MKLTVLPGIPKHHNKSGSKVTVANKVQTVFFRSLSAGVLHSHNKNRS
jgi:hypothetical protein